MLFLIAKMGISLTIPLTDCFKKSIFTLLSRTDYFIPAGIAISVTLIALLGSDATQWLRYDRDAIRDGQLWRLVTGHLVHLGWSHLALNVASLALIWAIFGSHIPWRRWIILLLVGAVSISVLLFTFNTHLRGYVGLSGVLHTLFIAGCLADLKHKRRDTRILLAVIAIKLAYEQTWGPMPGSESISGGNVVVAAHLYGAICGLVIMGIFKLKDQLAKPVKGHAA